jgi:hypothetical protein
MIMETEDRRTQGHWVLDKHISVGHIAATAVAVVSIVTWLMTMDKRVAVVESDMMHLSMSDVRLEAQMREALTKIDDKLNRIENKIDLKADKK